MTRIYFVRHCQSDHTKNTEERFRPLTAEGLEDSNAVLHYLKDKNIDVFISSPYKRSYDTIAKAAEYYHIQIKTDERLCERKSGKNGNNFEMFKKRWTDKNYAEADGESLYSVQKRNIKVITEITEIYQDKNIVVGTHGTALSAILNYYNPSFNCDDFIRIINYMPYIVKFEFNGTQYAGMTEELIIEKEYH
ncbi:MAG: histidine phosphatase family protein [Treponema sp.]